MKPHEEEAAFGFASMIDVVFLLLIFFLLQPFKSPEMKLPAPMKDGPNPILTIQKAVLIQIRGEGDRVTYVVDNRAWRDGADSLWLAIREASRENPEIPVSIQSDPRVKFQHVLKALDESRKAGMTKVGFSPPRRTTI